jgi:hypothetical protein
MKELCSRICPEDLASYKQKSEAEHHSGTLDGEEGDGEEEEEEEEEEE